jgi:hypothetical protein
MPPRQRLTTATCSRPAFRSRPASQSSVARHSPRAPDGQAPKLPLVASPLRACCHLLPCYTCPRSGARRRVATRRIWPGTHRPRSGRIDGCCALDGCALTTERRWPGGFAFPHRTRGDGRPAQKTARARSTRPFDENRDCLGVSERVARSSPPVPIRSEPIGKAPIRLLRAPNRSGGQARETCPPTPTLCGTETSRSRPERRTGCLPVPDPTLKRAWVSPYVVWLS